jgi:hypothetical protein
MENINPKTLKYRIMLRVWYAFFIARLDFGALGNGLLLGGAVALFGRLTHVSAITQNILEVPLGSLPGFVWGTITSALSGGEVLTVLITLAIVGLATGSSVRLWNVVAGDRRLAI